MLIFIDKIKIIFIIHNGAVPCISVFSLLAQRR
jgi:hypothetical protein